MTHGRKPEDINPKAGEAGGNPAAWGTFYREKLQIPLNPPFPKGDFNTPL